MIEDDELLKKYNTVWDKVSAKIKKEFDTKPMCNNFFLKTTMISHCDEDTNFYDEKIPKMDFNHTC